MHAPTLADLRKRSALLAPLVLAALLLALWAFAGLFERLELALYDQRLRLTPHPAADPRMVLLDIDDASLRVLGRWPWDRTVHARAMDVLRHCGAGLAVYDIVFNAQGSPAGDAALRTSLASFGRAVLPGGVALVKDGVPGDAPGMPLFVLRGQPPERLLGAGRTFPPRPELAEAALGVGHVAAARDADGALRSVPLALAAERRDSAAGEAAYVPSVDLLAAMALLGSTGARFDGADLVLDGPRPRRIPLDEEGRMLVNFAAPWGRGFTHIPFHQVANAAGNEDDLSGLCGHLRGGAALIGLVASGSTDMGPTPMGPSEPLVTIHSNAINAVLSGEFLRPAPAWANMTAGAVLSLLVGVIGLRLPARRFVPVGAGLLAAYAVLNVGAFVLARFVLDLSGVLWAGTSTFLVTLGWNYLRAVEEGERQRREREKFQVQLAAAARIQAGFLPSAPDLGAGRGAFAACHPAAFVGGDLYDALPEPGGSLLFLVADVSGKGLPAALVMSAVWSKFRSHGLPGRDLAEIARAVNVELFGVLAQEGNFVTFALARLAADGGSVSWVNGGHIPPLLADGKAARFLDGPRCLPLGVIEEAEYAAGVIELAPGESFVLVSDGVTEAESPDKELFGNERTLAGLLGDAPRGPALLQAVTSWRAWAQVSDDTTLFEVWRGDESP